MYLQISSRTSHTIMAVVAIALAFAGSAAIAQPGPYPNRVIKLIVPYSAGSGSDVLARAVGQKVSELSRQPVVIENRDGGNGIIGTNFVKNAAADGYTLLMVANPFTLGAGQYEREKRPYDPLKDFVPIAKFAIVPIVLTISPALPIKDVKELIAYAKANPGKLNYASTGAGAPSQLEMELFKQATSVDIVEIPYKSNAQAMTHVIGGQIEIYAAPMPLALQHVRSGRARALGLFDTRRSPLLPDVPHMAEALGKPGYVATPVWYGIVAPAGTPRDVMAAANRLIQDAVEAPEVKERLAGMGAGVVNPTNEEFAADMKAELEKSERLSKALGIAK